MTARRSADTLGPRLLLPPTTRACLFDLDGRHANGRLARTLGWGCFAVVCVLSVAAPVLLIATNGGGG